MVKHPNTRAERRRLKKILDDTPDRPRRKKLLEEVREKELDHEFKSVLEEA